MQDAARVRDATGRVSSGWSWGAVEGTQRDRDASDSPLPSGSSQSDGGGTELLLLEIPV